MRALPPVTRIPLGPAWAANSVNTCIYRHQALVSGGGWQFGAHYADAERLVVWRRRLADDLLERHVIAGRYGCEDAHNSISLGLDREGMLHLSYDHHVHPLRYRRGSRPYAIDAWSEPLAMTGVDEGGVTYPCFVHDSPADDRFVFLYRDGRSGDGDLLAKSWRDGRWRDHGVVLRGRGQAPWTTNAYWDRPRLRADGRLVLTFTWRVNDLVGAGGPWFNKDLCVAVVDLDARTWTTSGGRELPLPITPTICEVAWPVPPFSNLINSCGMDLDERGRPHVAHWVDGEDGGTTWHHVWLGEDGRWRRHALLPRAGRIDLAGPGFLRLPLSRPEILLDGADAAWVIARGDITGERMVALRLAGPSWRVQGEPLVLWDEPLGFAEPIVDLSRWRRERVLSLYVQANEQPQFDRPTPHPDQPAWVGDWRLPL